MKGSRVRAAEFFARLGTAAPGETVCGSPPVGTEVDFENLTRSGALIRTGKTRIRIFRPADCLAVSEGYRKGLSAEEAEDTNEMAMDRTGVAAAKGHSKASSAVPAGLTASFLWRTTGDDPGQFHGNISGALRGNSFLNGPILLVENFDLFTALPLPFSIRGGTAFKSVVWSGGYRARSVLKRLTSDSEISLWGDYDLAGLDIWAAARKENSRLGYFLPGRILSEELFWRSGHEELGHNKTLSEKTEQEILSDVNARTVLRLIQNTGRGLEQQIVWALLRIMME
jgi:hypothetical protein